MAALMKPQKRNSPIIIGGIGGSGTRVIAEILTLLDVYLGRALNKSLDNLWFTALFKRRDLFEKNPEIRKGEIREGLDILTEAMIGRRFLFNDLRSRVALYTKDIWLWRFRRRQ